MKNILRHSSSFITPIVVGFVLPYFIVASEQRSDGGPIVIASPSLAIIGSLIIIAGLAVVLATIRLFILMGRGTIMPWDPTWKLIIAGLYRHVRNPMILGVILIQTGEAVLLASSGVAWLAVLNFAVNTVYFVYSEEPGLEKRFGAEYVEYKNNVPRWIPRLKPWLPAAESS